MCCVTAVFVANLCVSACSVMGSAAELAGSLRCWPEVKSNGGLNWLVFLLFGNFRFLGISFALLSDDLN